MYQYIVYADLNCPFCYALHEQLLRYDLLDKVDWRLIEHAPDTALYNKTSELQAELASEVFIVRSRAPAVEISLPKIRSDSRFATLCVIEARQQDRSKAEHLTTLLYRALWIDSKDIADVSVIFDCLTQAGLSPELDIDESEEALLVQWQKEWQEGGFNGSTPVITSTDGRSLIGLSSTEDLTAFFQGEEVHSQVQPTEFSQALSPQTIAIFCDHSIEKIWPVVAILRKDFNILLPPNLPELKNLLVEDPPDLLLLSTEQQWSDMLSLCHETTANQEELPPPVAMISQESDDQIELDAYNAGAADFLVLSRNPAILQSRIQILMKLKQTQDLLARSARIDGLTQVNNRSEFDRSIETEWRRALRSKRRLNLIMMDIDSFKEFNDFYGHLAGDGCLRTVAQTIKSCVKRAQDMVCRYGGEEFAVILPETDLHGASILAEKLRMAVEALQIEHYRSKSDGIVTISLGVASITPAKGGSPNELIEQADQLLYQAKQNGRNRTCIQSSPAEDDSQ